MMGNKETVCAVVVTYNRKNLLIECLDAICNQTRKVDAIYIIDNCSTDGTPELLFEKGYIHKLPPNSVNEPYEIESNPTDKPKIYYVRMHENTGGAGGFYEGVKRGYEKGYDWLWLMDDDVEPLPNGLETMLKFSDISKCIHPSKEYPNGDRFFWEGFIDERSGFLFSTNDEFIEEKEWTCVNYGCFEGMLIHRDIVKKIGYPDKKLFSISDDTIYGYLASKVTNVIYIRDVCLKKKIDNRGKELSRLAIYLYCRNYLGYVTRLIARRKYIWFIYSVFYLVKLILGRLIKSRSLLKASDAIKGYLDGIRNKWGGEKNYL